MPIVGLPIVTFPPLSRSLLKLYKSCKFADPLLTISTSLVHVTCAPVTCATVYMLLMSYCSSAFHCNAHLVLCSSSVSMRVGVCKPFQLVMRRQRWHLREPLSIEATFIWSLSAGYALTRNTLCEHLLISLARGITYFYHVELLYPSDAFQVCWIFICS